LTVASWTMGELRRYTTVPGFFLQDDPESKEDNPQAIPLRFGLKDDSADRWTKFKTEIERLHVNAPPETRYKVIFLGRHGEGYHNLGVEKYGEEWTNYWARRNGDGELVWGPDPELTALGIEQAEDAHRAWKTELEYGIPLPEKLYCSPLSRAIKTNQVTFRGLVYPELKTTIVENIRERNGISTCNERRKMSEIAKDFPDYPFEKGFAEDDETWDPDLRETPEEIDVRAKKVLDMIFNDDEEHYISVTSHVMFINSVLRVCEHRPRRLPTGGVIPVVLRAEKLLPN